MRTFFLSAVFASAVALTAFDAQALPGSAQNPASIPADVIQVAGGCGPGWHRGPFGGCVRNWWRPGPFAYAGPRCWWRRTPWGPRRVCAW
jgi:hypothetical protein